jgi:hypothetical protein
VVALEKIGILPLPCCNEGRNDINARCWTFSIHVHSVLGNTTPEWNSEKSGTTSICALTLGTSLVSALYGQNGQNGQNGKVRFTCVHLTQWVKAYVHSLPLSASKSWLRLAKACHSVSSVSKSVPSVNPVFWNFQNWTWWEIKISTSKHVKTQVSANLPFIPYDSWKSITSCREVSCTGKFWAAAMQSGVPPNVKQI